MLTQILPSAELPQDRLNQVATPTHLVQHDPEGLVGSISETFPTVSQRRERGQYEVQWTLETLPRDICIVPTHTLSIKASEVTLRGVPGSELLLCLWVGTTVITHCYLEGLPGQRKGRPESSLTSRAVAGLPVFKDTNTSFSFIPRTPVSITYCGLLQPWAQRCPVSAVEQQFISLAHRGLET